MGMRRRRRRDNFLLSAGRWCLRTARDMGDIYAVWRGPKAVVEREIRKALIKLAMRPWVKLFSGRRW